MRARRGFTLVELLAVIGIIAVLLAIAIPVTSRVIEGGHAAACLGHLRQLGTGLNAYLAEHDATMPTMMGGRASLAEEVPVIDTVLAPYLSGKAVFACPSDRKFAAASGTSYYWNVALNDQRLGGLNFLRLTEEQSKIPILSDKEGFHPYTENKVNLLYADGHATKDLKFRTE